MDDIDFTILAATSVLGDLVEKCPPAQACKEAFERMSKATVTMCLANNSGTANIPSSLGGMGIGIDPRLDAEMRRRSAGRNVYSMGGNGVSFSQRNRVLQDLSGGFQLPNNQIFSQPQHHPRRQQQLRQQAYPQQDQRWNRQMQYQSQQYQQQQSRRINPVRAPAIFDIGFENLLQSGQGVQMSESSYRSTQQPMISQRSQQSMACNTIIDSKKRTECNREMSDVMTEAGQQFSSPSPLSSPLHPPSDLDRNIQQLRAQPNHQRQQKDQNHTSAGSMPVTHGDVMSPVNNETMIDPELQSDGMESLSMKQSPGSEETMHPSPSTFSDSNGGCSNQNTGIYEISGVDHMEWNLNWEELEGGSDGGMGMGMGMGQGQVDYFDGFFFGSSGTGGN